MHIDILNIIFIIIIFSLGGCATSPDATPEQAYPQTTVSTREIAISGACHKVLPGQTLWRIAKAYDVDIDDVVRANSIEDPSKIETGQMIIIPGASEPISGEIERYTSKSRKGYIWPVEGRVISYYGTKRDDVYSKGIDIEANEGKTVVAAKDGKVVFCDEKVKGLGKVIIIDHGDGFSTLYAHNAEIEVKCGQYVKQGEVISRVGSSGRAKRPMLHFQVRKGHKPQNPFYYLP